MTVQPSSRIQGNIVNRAERRILDWACTRMPREVTSDHLTLFGVFGAILVACSYAATRLNPHFLWLAAAGYVIHWFGDSLDGSLARYRRTTRPRYGHFLDHSVDAFCILLMFGGLGLTPYVRMDVALFTVVGYFALSMHVFLKERATNTFQLSFMAFGPTEMRIVFAAITVWMFTSGGLAAHFPGSSLTDYDIALLSIGGVFLALFMLNTLTMIFTLRAEEGDGRRPSMPVTPEPFRPALGRRSGL